MATDKGARAVQPAAAQDFNASDPQVDERIWQAWLRKGREQDRALQARFRVLGILLAVAIAVAAVIFWRLG